ncbi:unnamed protein product, partial [Ascophyllum nodosum]
ISSRRASQAATSRTMRPTGSSRPRILTQKTSGLILAMNSLCQTSSSIQRPSHSAWSTLATIRTSLFFITTSTKPSTAEEPHGYGETRDSEGREQRVVTLVLVVKPRGVIEACYLEVSTAQACGEEPLDLFSDIKFVQPHPDPSAWKPARSYPFPLGGGDPRLCSQGVGGRFTHFYPGTHHALDFECPKGTPVLSLSSGVVKQVRQTNRAGGIHARGLFDWNSVTILQDDGLLAEYVHILADSALVAPGDRVSAGQPLCESGDAGFCPTPHLHLQLQEGEEDSAPTVLFSLLDHEGNPYFPVAGKWYGSRGEM